MGLSDADLQKIADQWNASADGKKKLNFAIQVDRHRGFFVRRRAESIGSLPANAAMIQDPDLKVLKARIDNEYVQLDAFLVNKTKELNPATGGTDIDPPHLDLHDLAKPKDTTSASDGKSKEQEYRRRRNYRVSAIGWRAAAIHGELWNASADGKTAILRTKALDEIIDRRLRMVERMNFQVSRADALGGAWTFTGGGILGPWKDGFRIRMFEYPRIPHNVVAQVVSFLGSTNIANENREPFTSTDPPWRWEVGRRRLIYNVGPEPGVQFAPPERSDWSPNKYFQDLTPDSGHTAAGVIDTLFTPDPDWWGRSWLFCDHVISALHIEALLFGLRRADPAHGEEEFNSLVTGHPKGFV
jgi:hypothetical protein